MSKGPPRVPLALIEAIGAPAIRDKLWDLEQEYERIQAELAANRREYDELILKNNQVAAHHDRLTRKLRGYDDE